MSGGSIALSAAAHVPPLHTSKSLQQLCARWQHNLDVGFTPERCQISFPSDARGADWPDDALVAFKAAAHGLDVRIEASAVGQLEALKGAAARHLGRLAFPRGPTRL